MCCAFESQNGGRDEHKNEHHLSGIEINPLWKKHILKTQI